MWSMLRMAMSLAGNLVTLPGTIELSVLTTASLLPRRRRASARGSAFEIVVVVPAHDEAAGIARCVRSLRACDAPPGGFSVLVVADNCTDSTAARAREAGADVLERRDEARRGKGYALEAGFAHALARPSVGAVIVVDADTEVEPNFLIAMAEALDAGADAVQCRYAMALDDDADTRALLMSLAFRATGVVRCRGRERLGLSVGILGNGFGLRREVIERVPYVARSVVEDLEYHLMLVRAGYRVRFVEATQIAAPPPSDEAAIRTQRVRWEGGRYRMLREHVPSLAREVLSGRPALLEPLLELMLLPLGTHVGVLGATLAVPFLPGQLAAAASLGVVAAHVSVASLTTGASAREIAALRTVPRYLAEKLGMLPVVLSAATREQAWVRTPRERETVTAEGR
jgi:cellulose synthase/poly-beta-1,6-N-acetylglucosamine synthase-like glycosyltransferase